MNWQVSKTFVAATVSLVLVYYSAAWAVLHCLHDEEHLGFEESRFVIDYYGNASLLAPTGESDCLEHHLESLAGSAPETSIDRVTSALTYRVKDVFNSTDQVHDHFNNPLSILLARGSSPPVRYKLSLLVSLSVLRI